MYLQDELRPISALQHILFCERQCALIHTEQIWEENYFTASGDLFHQKADTGVKEKRVDVIQEFGLPIRSLKYGLIGKADVVEIHRNEKKEIAQIVPIEYKSGKPKDDAGDEVQVCAQALCLEEMLDISIANGFLFYGKDRRRHRVDFTEALRSFTIATAERLHALLASGITPEAQYTKRCKSCSLLQICLPRSAGRKKSIKRYIAQFINKEESGI